MDASACLVRQCRENAARSRSALRLSNTNALRCSESCPFAGVSIGPRILPRVSHAETVYAFPRATCPRIQDFLAWRRPDGNQGDMHRTKVFESMIEKTRP